MAPTVSTDGLKAEPGPLQPTWHRWRSLADGRFWAARTTAPATLLSAPMIVSADSDEDLERALANAAATQGA